MYHLKKIIELHPFPEHDFLGSLKEDDPRLIQIIRNWFLEPPSGKNFHLSGLKSLCVILMEKNYTNQNFMGIKMPVKLLT